MEGARASEAVVKWIEASDGSDRAILALPFNEDR